MIEANQWVNFNFPTLFSSANTAEHLATIDLSEKDPQQLCEKFSILFKAFFVLSVWSRKQKNPFVHGHKVREIVSESSPSVKLRCFCWQIKKGEMAFEDVRGEEENFTELN